MPFGEKMNLEEFVVHCMRGIGINDDSSGLTTQPPCWYFEHEHVSGSLYFHKAFIYLPIKDANKFMNKLTSEAYKLKTNVKKINGIKPSEGIIYQRVESYQIPAPDPKISDIKTSANEIEIRVFEDLDLDLDLKDKQKTINSEEFSFRMKTRLKRKKEEEKCQN